MSAIGRPDPDWREWGRRYGLWEMTTRTRESRERHIVSLAGSHGLYWFAEDDSDEWFELTEPSRDWCQTHVKGDYYVSGDHPFIEVWFELAEEAALFRAQFNLAK